MATWNFNSVPITNATVSTLVFIAPGCGSLRPGEASVFTGGVSEILDFDWFGVFRIYQPVTTRTWSPPTFLIVTACTPQMLSLLAVFDDTVEKHEWHSSGTARLVREEDAQPEP